MSSKSCSTAGPYIKSHNNKRFFKGNMTELLKRKKKKKRLQCTRRPGKTQDKQPCWGTITCKTIKWAKNNAWKPRLVKTFALNTSAWLQPPHTVGPMPRGQRTTFFPHKCNHWVVHLKKYLLKENSLLTVHHRKAITPYHMLKWGKKRFPSAA